MVEEEQGINVLSLFDGISCGQVALDNLNIKINKYIASEINKNSILVTQKNFPNTIQLGDIRDINKINLPKIDLLIGGSPCQDFSQYKAGYGKGIEGEKSKLFKEYLRLLRDLKPTYFLLENVPMKKEWKDLISKELRDLENITNKKLKSFELANRDFTYNGKEVEGNKPLISLDN